MALTPVRPGRRIGYLARLRASSELARQRERLQSAGCERIFESDAAGDWRALHDAISGLQAGDQLVMCSVAELALPSFLLRDLVARHGATVLTLEI